MAPQVTDCCYQRKVLYVGQLIYVFSTLHFSPLLCLSVWLCPSPAHSHLAGWRLLGAPSSVPQSKLPFWFYQAVCILSQALLLYILLCNLPFVCGMLLHAKPAPENHVKQSFLIVSFP